MLALALSTNLCWGQPIVVIPGSTGGIGSSPNDGVGVFTTTPMDDFFDVTGDVRLNGGAADEGVWFSSPNGEKGLSIRKTGVNNRADIRFDGYYLKMVAATGTSVPSSSNGLSVSTSGFVGVGVDTPSDRLTVKGGVAVYNTGLDGSTFQKFVLYSDASNGLYFDAPKNDLNQRLPISFCWRGDANPIMTMSGNRNVGIGTTSLTNSNRLTIAGDATHTTGTRVDMVSVAASGYAIGSDVNMSGNLYNTGTRAITTGGSANYAGQFISNNAGFSNVGVNGQGNGGEFNTGGDFKANTSTVKSTGVAGDAQNSNTECVGGAFTASNAPSVTGSGGGAWGNNLPGSMARGGQFGAIDAETNIGIEALATGTDVNILNYAVSAVATQNHGDFNYGVRTNASTHEGAIANYGVYSLASVGGTTCNNYGVYSEISGGNPAPAPGSGVSGAGSYAGYFRDNSVSGFANGAAFFNGKVVTTVTGLTAISDKKFKKDINTMDNTLEGIMKLRPATYTFKGKDEFPSFSFQQGKQFGFIAQELEEVFPEIVHESINPAQYDDKGNKTVDAVTFKGVDYTSLIPVLVSGMQEQQGMITQLQQAIVEKDAQIDELTERIKRLENGATGVGNAGSAATGAMLYQNAPNPFNGTTEIGYFIPSNSSNASIMVFDMNGKKLSNFELYGNGKGSISIDARNWAAGIYMYSLVIDGREIATKRMIISK